MWIYLEDLCCAFNVQDGHSIDSRVNGEGKITTTFKYKDMDGKMCSYDFVFSSNADVVRRTCNTLLRQLKEVSGAKVTQELEDAIARGGTNNG